MWLVVVLLISVVVLFDDFFVVVVLIVVGYLMLLYFFNIGSFRYVGIGGVGGVLEVRVWEGYGVFVVCLECGY